MELFAYTGVHCVVDGQFGSTGKGVLAAWLAERAIANGTDFALVVSNAGPNSGHTFYHGDEKHVLKQLPTFAVAQYLAGFAVPVFLSAGAIIDAEILCNEAIKYPGITIFVHPNAAVIDTEDKRAEHSGSVAAVAGTRSGTGAALARKVLRDPSVVFSAWWTDQHFPPNVVMGDPISDGIVDPFEDRIFMEVSQGFSLGLNSSEFYPKTTSRECTVMQGISDARIPPRAVERTYLSMRTFPIRVGNVDGFSSGEFYPDQEETTWEAIGQTPELTTVTQRVRRVFTFSEIQAEQAIAANDPDFVFINFLNYLDDEGQADLMYRLDGIRDDTAKWFEILQGFGPKSEDVKW
jgi:adenylosuccinate synthase